MYSSFVTGDITLSIQDRTAAIPDGLRGPSSQAAPLYLYRSGDTGRAASSTIKDRTDCEFYDKGLTHAPYILFHFYYVVCQ